MSYAARAISVRIGPAMLMADVSIEVQPGEVVAVAGPNGAGKSTLLSVLARDRQPTSGSVVLAGRPIEAWPRGDLARRRAVMLPGGDVAFPFTPLADGQELVCGNVVIRVLHTPGHTPESLCLVVTDKTRGPEPWFVLTGDTLFSGGVGRPDLLGAGSEATLVRQLHESLHGKLLTLPDHLEIFPSHFGGAACGRGLSGKPGSTIGFEPRFNPALQARSPAEFVELVLGDLPPQPEIFIENRRRNLTGV